MPAQPPSWFDWLTLAAIFFGPILALLTQRALERFREKKRRRTDVYMTLMSLRAAPLHPEHVRALNSIDAVFDDARGKDAKVRDAWGAVLAHASGGDPNSKAWQDRIVFTATWRSRNS